MYEGDKTAYLAASRRPRGFCVSRSGVLLRGGAVPIYGDPPGSVEHIFGGRSAGIISGISLTPPSRPLPWLWKWEGERLPRPRVLYRVYRPQI